MGQHTFLMYCMIKFKKMVYDNMKKAQQIHISIQTWSLVTH